VLPENKTISSLMPSKLVFGVASPPADDRPEYKKRRTLREWWDDFLDFEKRKAKREKL
jgi:hypothetical protein